MFAKVFAAGPDGAFKYVALLTLGTTAATYRLAIPDGLTADRVIVCRGGWRADRDDVNVTSIAGVCR